MGLTATRTVMHRDNWSDDGMVHWFTDRASSDDGSVEDRAMVLTDEHWRELGSPETITVTVEPRDRLNG